MCIGGHLRLVVHDLIVLLSLTMKLSLFATDEVPEGTYPRPTTWNHYLFIS